MDFELSDPDLRSTERETLEQFLDYYRAVLWRKAEGLDADQLAARLGPSSLTIGGLVKHMAGVEDNWFVVVWQGAEASEPWASADWDADPDWELNSAGENTLDELRDLYETAIARSRTTLSTVTDLDEVSSWPSRHDGEGHFSMRWILVHMIEEYARHCGHADLIRESIDGATGD